MGAVGVVEGGVVGDVGCFLLEEEDGRCGGLEVVVVLNLSYFEEFLMIIEAIERIHEGMSGTSEKS